MTLKKAFPRAAVLGAVMTAAGFLASAAYAQDTISESHLEAAKKVAEVTRVMEPFDNILPLLAEQTRTAFVQADPTRAEEIIEITQEVAIQLASKRSELNQKVYQTWAENFTEEELKELAVFYATELGQKLTNKVPVVTQVSVGAAREWQDKISTEMVTMVQEELVKRNGGQ
ncbi:DUF2059 domain-containing protein [Roseibium sp. MMSF_3544]|uniref:DUF2059 domain-containing protein n=1 Tax=unclassified Roseibium TaxID=2629323 RepID=UPI00273FFC0E|nr:DUF2059 domain-containing protein [Roseibium sp. MMSF_3544]